MRRMIGYEKNIDGGNSDRIDVIGFNCKCILA